MRAGQPVTAYGGTPLTEGELGGMRNCLKNHWGDVGKEVYEMFSSHVKVATTSHEHACSIDDATDAQEVLNSRPDKPGALHCLEYFLIGGLMGGFINSAVSKSEQNVEWRKILTPKRVDHTGRSRGVSQVCFATQDIEQDTVIRYVYVYSNVRGVGRWFEGEDELSVGDYKVGGLGRCRTLGDYLEWMHMCFTKNGLDVPNKSVSGAPMRTQVSTYSNVSQCSCCCGVRK
jgi:hypothetical protein